MKKPRIGITCGPNIDRLPPYLKAFTDNGAEGVVFQAGAATAPEVLSSCDGILIPGGGDVDPLFYTNHVHPSVNGIDRGRDLFEKEVILAAHAAGKPLMGICRGVQVMGWAFGGTLHQDIDASHFIYPNKESHHIAHTMAIEPDSHLAKILGVTSVEVNSIHHQAVETAHPPLRAVGRAPDGFIEALEDTAHPWFIGVQCHPERLPNNVIWQKFFNDFIKRCASSQSCGRP